MPLSEKRQVLTNDADPVLYGDTLSNENLFLSVTQVFQSNKLFAAIIEYLKTIPQLVYLFGENMSYYKQQDYGTSVFPALNVYSIAEAYRGGDLGWLDGRMGIDIILPMSGARDELVDRGMRLANMINYYIGTFDSFEYLKPYCPGLVGLNNNAKWSYDQISVRDGTKATYGSSASCVSDYSVNMLQYYLAVETGPRLSTVNISISPES